MDTISSESAKSATPIKFTPAENIFCYCILGLFIASLITIFTLKMLPSTSTSNEPTNQLTASQEEDIRAYNVLQEAMHYKPPAKLQTTTVIIQKGK